MKHRSFLKNTVEQHILTNTVFNAVIAWCGCCWFNIKLVSVMHWAGAFVLLNIVASSFVCARRYKDMGFFSVTLLH